MSVMEISLCPNVGPLCSSRHVPFTLFILGIMSVSLCGETLLTNGNETLDADQQQQQQSWSGLVHVEGYNQYDQCMRAPGYSTILHNAIAFRLGTDQMNSGNGLVICYQGQLDKYNQVKGINADIPYRVNNVKGNRIGNWCESARKQLASQCQSKTSEEERDRCEQFVRFPWHGIQLVDDPNNVDNTVVYLSTTDQNFPIPRQLFEENGDRLFLKLAKWYRLGSQFSRHIGPDPFINRLCFGQDCQLQKLFVGNAEGAAFLRDYMGIWALALDVLTKEEGATHLDFFVIRSKCSEMAASMLLPWDVATNMLPHAKPKTNKAHSASKGRITIVKNSVVEIRGKVEQNMPSFEIVLTLEQIWKPLVCEGESPPPAKLLSIRLQFDFEHGKTRMVKQMGSQEGLFGKVTDEQANVLHPGQHFYLKATALEDSVNVALNCMYNQTFAVGNQLPFNLPLIYEINGAEIYDIDTVGSITSAATKSVEKFWLTTDKSGLPIGDGRGLYISGKPGINWKKISLVLADFEMNSLLSIVVNRTDDRVYLKWAAPNRTVCKESEPYIKDTFELYIELHVQSILVVLNDKELESTMHDAVQVMHVQMEADHLDGQLDRNITTWTIPKEGRVFLLKEPHDTGTYINIVGKFLSKATTLQVKLLNLPSQDVEKAEECFFTETNKRECTLSLDITVQLEQNTATVRYQEYMSKRNVWMSERNYNTAAHFVKGQEFSMQIDAINCKNTNGIQQARYAIEQIEENIPIPRNPVNLIWVNIDDGTLFDEPKIEDHENKVKAKDC